MTTVPFHLLKRQADDLRCVASQREKMSERVRISSEACADRMMTEVCVMRSRAFAMEAESRIVAFQNALSLHKSATLYSEWAAECGDPEDAQRLWGISALFTMLGNRIERLVAPGDGRDYPPSPV